MYDVKYWKKAHSATVGEVCSYLQKNIPPEAVFHVCGSDMVYFHMDTAKSAFSVDYEPLSELQEYDDCEPTDIYEDKAGLDYSEFMQGVVDALKKFYSFDAQVSVEAAKDSGNRYHGSIRIKLNGQKTEGLFDVDKLYSEYHMGNIDIEGCVEEIYRKMEKDGTD